MTELEQIQQALPLGWNVKYEGSYNGIKEYTAWHDDYDGPECPLICGGNSKKDLLDRIQEISKDTVFFVV